MSQPIPLSVQYYISSFLIAAFYWFACLLVGTILNRQISRYSNNPEIVFQALLSGGLIPVGAVVAYGIVWALISGQAGNLIEKLFFM